MLSVELFGWCNTGCLPSSAVCGRSLDFPEAKSPWALGADATLRSFLANSSFPAVVASPLPPSACVCVIEGGLEGDAGTLPSL
jgi:hypothetical protein